MGVNLALPMVALPVALPPMTTTFNGLGNVQISARTAMVMLGGTNGALGAVVPA
jgi:hypothetical protein